MYISPSIYLYISYYISNNNLVVVGLGLVLALALALALALGLAVQVALQAKVGADFPFVLHFDGPASRALAPAIISHRWGKGLYRWTVEMLLKGVCSKEALGEPRSCIATIKALSLYLSLPLARRSPLPYPSLLALALPILHLQQCMSIVHAILHW